MLGGFCFVGRGYNRGDRNDDPWYYEEEAKEGKVFEVRTEFTASLPSQANVTSPPPPDIYNSMTVTTFNEFDLDVHDPRLKILSRAVIPKQGLWKSHNMVRTVRR